MKNITNTDLMSIASYKFPITAISSILHRISGVVLLIAMPVIVVCMHYSLAGPNGYADVEGVFKTAIGSFFLWGFLSAITFHIYAGVRHMIMDLGFGESMFAAKTTSVLVLVLGVVSAILWGCFLWV